MNKTEKNKATITGIKLFDTLIITIILLLMVLGSFNLAVYYQSPDTEINQPTN